jgi:hypothetical protein
MQTSRHCPCGRRPPGSGRTRTGAAAVASMLLLTFALAACGSKSSTTSSEFLNTGQTKGAIEESILTQRHIHATVVCPSEVVREKGAKFDCVATTPNGARTVFHVTEANARGYVEYSSLPENANKAATEKPHPPATKTTSGHKKP